ncbi:ATP-dependent sacrificial sulfur transferase LarE [Georgenia faecalis]|uniref:ATP-dependent sacrificial sulfur transferase LarE n=1 Tax=Georgenia faecalis TaxID=2483799 RepID=A0ABV9D7J3_9MICO|nr:ATP-dependent sacrificial sulfur transferase LarE [Georgenia faecalis]
MTHDLPADTQAAAARVGALLAGRAPLGVAYSGGVDSATLLALAVRALGAENVVAILGVSPSLATDERRAAHATAATIGARVVEVTTHEGDVAAYRANGPDRCFHCKDELFARISDELVAELGLVAVAYGENADDALRPDRPGAQAATDHAVLRPLADAGLTKAMVRAVARSLDLPVADKPAAPCLASRIPHFEEVTPAKLRQVDVAEAAVRRLGFADCRVRHHGEVARLELPAEDIARAAALHDEVHAAVSAAGFRFVALDLRGIQSGAFTLPLVAVRP